MTPGVWNLKVPFAFHRSFVGVFDFQESIRQDLMTLKTPPSGLRVVITFGWGDSLILSELLVDAKHHIICSDLGAFIYCFYLRQQLSCFMCTKVIR